ncbi:MAG: Formate--tetrahydrofolate ligase [Halieaceae bacterium]|nr:MAG: Formate--tetrahydrofolate ligase [Halieaceae bacterium]|tara:strand:- start:310 stop:1995 length:1686 start_codon:yes stop_codon:yes gene_type:complete
MTSDIEIAQAATPRPIAQIADELKIPETALEPYGRIKGKVNLNWLLKQPIRDSARMILVTAISPTPAGEGKTTTTVGLGDALKHIGKDVAICLREPSLGPVFGMKGGAAGGGYAQVIPMEDINLHFNGDLHAIGVANNLLAALLDNHIHHGNVLDIDVRRVTWKRVLDMNDRALRDITVSLGGPGNGYPRQDGFDIVVASEIMAIFCLATDLDDLKARLGRIVVAYTRDRQPVTAADLKAEGALTAVLKDALAPNLVQTLEGTPAFVHGGPFANIAHGCNSVIATTAGLRLADFVVTEAGFGADLGAEKFIDIKCRSAGIRPSAAVLVATIRALKFHGGVPKENLSEENLVALQKGLANLDRHITNIRDHYGVPVVVSINQFIADTQAEIDLVIEHCQALGIQVALSSHWAHGGAGATDLAHMVAAICESDETSANTPHHSFVYEDSASLWEKIELVATTIYGASEITGSSKVRDRLRELTDSGYGHLPVCIAKTPYSFSTDPALKGAPSGHVMDIREIRLSVGAGFVVAVCGDVMTMPGLPKVPASQNIDVVDGQIVGLF